MRVRGRRVVLLIAGALPLLAEDQRSTAIDDTPNHIHVQDAPSQEDALAVPAAEALHEVSFSLLPLNLLQMESEFVNETHVEKSVTAGVVRTPIAAIREAINRIEEVEEDEVLEDTGREPPDKQKEVTPDGDTVEDCDRTAMEDDQSGIKDREVVPEGEAEEESRDKLQVSANLVADAVENIEEETSLEVTETKEEIEGKTGTETETTQDESINEGESDEDLVTGSEEEEDTDGGELTTKADDIEEDISDGTDNASDGVSDPLADSQDDTPTEQQEEEEEQEQQQPTPEPQVDKIDDEEDGGISTRVAVDYASKSAGALVLEKSHNFKGASNLLNGDRDKYAISPCEEKKFVVLSLSEDILVKQVKLANYELYSSRVKDFQIEISATMGNWVDLGSYTASPASGVQSFDLREPAWGRYLMFKFNSHYGDEYYCTLSQIMVHGSTMVQGFHEHLQEASEELEEQEQDEESLMEGEQAMDAAPDDSTEASTSEVFSEEEQEKQQEMAEKETTQLADGEEAEDAEASSTKPDGAMLQSADEGNSASDDDSIEIEDLTSADDQEASHTTTEENEQDKNEMSSKKSRNSSATLPAASISLSSNVFTTIIGRLEPLQLKSIHRLSTMHAPDSNQLQNILAKASDSTKAIKKALTDPAILDNLQLWNEANIEEPFPPEAFGSTAIGPREQTLSEKLAAYIEDSDDNDIATDEGKNEDSHEEDDQAIRDASVQVEKVEAKEDSQGKKPKQGEVIIEADDAKNELPGEEQSGAKTGGPIDDAYENLHDTDLALASLLDKLPSIQCLKKLDFVAFKEKVLASRKGGHGAGGHAASGNPAEPIFKMLTDQIKVLQSNLSVHDQFTKEAVQCYQRVLLDVVVELQTMRIDHEVRLKKLEEDLEETKTVRWIFVLYQLVMGLPNWASLLAATFFTSFVSPNAVTKPLEVVQGLLDKYVSEGDHVFLSWTITACIMVLCCVTTMSLCHRLLSAVRYFKRSPEIEESAAAKKAPTEENSCRFTVENAEGKLVSVSTKPVAGAAKSEEEPSNGDENGSEEPIATDKVLETSVPTDLEEQDMVIASKPSLDPPGVSLDVESRSATPCAESEDEPAMALGPSPLELPIDQNTNEGAPMQKEEVATSTDHEVIETNTGLPSAHDGGVLAIAETSDNCAVAAETPTPIEESTEERIPGLVVPTKEVEIALTVTMKSDSPVATNNIGTGDPPSLHEETNTTQELVEATEPRSHEPTASCAEIEIADSLLTGEIREESRAQTPDVQTEALLETVTKGPVSPSSVAKVSEFAGADRHCFEPEEEAEDLSPCQEKTQKDNSSAEVSMDQQEGKCEEENEKASF